MINDCFIRFAFTLSASQVLVVRKWCGIVNIHIFQFFHMGARFCFLPANLISSTERTYIPNTVLSPIRVLIKLLRIAFPKSNPADGWPYRCRSRSTTVFLTVPYEFGHLSRGIRIQISGQSDWGILNNLGASSNFTWVWADTASAACPSPPGNLAITSMILQQSFGAQKLEGIANLPLSPAGPLHRVSPKLSGHSMVKSASFVTLHLRDQNLQCIPRNRRNASAIGCRTSQPI